MFDKVLIVNRDTEMTVLLSSSESLQVSRTFVPETVPRSQCVVSAMAWRARSMDGEVPQQVHSLLSDNGYSFRHFLNLLVQFWPPYHLSQYYNMHIIYI